MSYTPTFATLHHIEIQKLAELKAPGTCWAVVAALNSFAQDKTSCFPSIQTIMQYLGGSYGRRAIHRALKWLEDHGLIVRNHRRSKSRFVLKLRSMAYSGIEALKRKRQSEPAAYEDKASPIREHEKNHLIINKGKSSSRGKCSKAPERSKNRSIFAKKRSRNRIGGGWSLPVYPPDETPILEQKCGIILGHYFNRGRTPLTAEERATLTEMWNSSTYWASWLKENNPEIASELQLQ